MQFAVTFRFILSPSISTFLILPYFTSPRLISSHPLLLAWSSPILFRLILSYVILLHFTFLTSPHLFLSYTILLWLILTFLTYLLWFYLYLFSDVGREWYTRRLSALTWRPIRFVLTHTYFLHVLVYANTYQNICSIVWHLTTVYSPTPNPWLCLQLFVRPLLETVLLPALFFHFLNCLLILSLFLFLLFIPSPALFHHPERLFHSSHPLYDPFMYYSKSGWVKRVDRHSFRCSPLHVQRL